MFPINGFISTNKLHPQSILSVSSTTDPLITKINKKDTKHETTGYLIQNEYLNNLRDKHNDTIIKKDYKITKQYQYPLEGYNLQQILSPLNDYYNEETKQQLQKVLQRNSMSDKNVTLPVALLLLNPIEYPTLSRARREIRKGNILLSQQNKLKRGKANDRIHPLDIIAKQVYMSEKNIYEGMLYEQPNIPITVKYEDDHIAVITKPAGVPIIPSRKDGHRRHTIQAALPFILKPPSFPTELRYPHHCHRLDMPTSGLVVVAKTKPALVAMSTLFECREVDKTYTAIINGIPDESLCTSLTREEAERLGVNHSWNIINEELDNKPCITLWRTLQTSHSTLARDNTLTKIEIKLKTGRYHQIRRHMSWVLHCPIVGDSLYESEYHIKGYGLLLCANRIKFVHPMNRYSHHNDMETNIDVGIDLPDKFNVLMKKGR